MREWFTNAIVIGLSLALLCHFSLIAIYGAVTIQEPNILVFSLEVTALISFVIFAVVNMIKVARSK